MHYTTLTINLSHVDAAGVIFYPRLFQMSQQVMEDYLNTLAFDKNDRALFSIATAVESQKQIPLVVNCEASYYRAMRLSQVFVVEMSCSHIGTSSFVLEFRFIATRNADLRRAARNKETETMAKLVASQIDDSDIHAKAKVVHVVVDRDSRQKTNISPAWKNNLEKLQNGVGL